MLLFSLSNQWSSLPPMPIERSDCFAGLVTYPNGKQGILVAGGISSSEPDATITNFMDLDTLVLDNKANLPYRMSNGASVPFKDSFLIVGGQQNSTGKSDLLWYYNPLT